MSEDYCSCSIINSLNSIVNLLMLLTVLAIAVLRFINTRSQLKTNDLKNEYFMNKNKKKWKQYTV